MRVRRACSERDAHKRAEKVGPWEATLATCRADPRSDARVPHWRGSPGQQLFVFQKLNWNWNSFQQLKESGLF